MDPELKWLVKTIVAGAGFLALLQEGHRRGWI